MKKIALVSVYNKVGIVELAQFLVKENYSLISTGGTSKVLTEANLPVTQVSEYTGTAEILDGRVKTLHPRIHGGILGRRDDKTHTETMTAMDINPIDVVVVNLYPFFEKSGENLPFDELVEFIDIGGPAMLRSAAKNYTCVAVLTDPADYIPLMNEWRTADGNLSRSSKQRLAGKAFALTGAYDSAIARTLLPDDAPEFLSSSYRKKSDLRYGENPHQKAAWYVPVSPSDYGALSSLEQHQGKELSFNNLRDLDGAWRAVNEHRSPACVGVKHAAPCAASLADTPLEAWTRVRKADPVSIFGGIVAFNCEVDEETAQSLSDLFLEVIAAPKYSQSALAQFQNKKNLRVITLPGPPAAPWEALPIDGGLCLQEIDRGFIPEAEWTVPTRIKPTKKQMIDLAFAWRVVKHVKSNGIVLAADTSTVGIGSGQPNRIGAVEIAIAAAGPEARGAVLASDAFFPFDDGITSAVEAGIKAVIQPGGSLRDMDSIKVCDAAGIPMLFTGRRHFKH